MFGMIYEQTFSKEPAWNPSTPWIRSDWSRWMQMALQQWNQIKRMLNVMIAHISTDGTTHKMKLDWIHWMLNKLQKVKTGWNPWYKVFQ